MAERMAQIEQRAVTLLGPAGSGQLTKLINQLLFNICCAGVAEVLPMAAKLGLDPEKALAMATSTPAALIGMGGSLGHLAVGRRADMVYLAPDWHVQKIWWGGIAL